ncbi:MAG: precorrin-2 C(20)-methyltransferase [Candidatus Bathyarchaeota archaeon]|nr:precorrin-2 C(20)-methyltransferase [Candidatus Bathyarchaeota archaeon]
MVGKFVGVGVGPGDPDLITVKAIKTLKTADVICIPKSHSNKPSMALGMVKQILKERHPPPEMLELVFPMTKNELSLRKLWAENAKIVAGKVRTGKTLVFITLGDPMLYSTFMYLYRKIKKDYPDIRLEIIPGVTSVTAAAASAQLPLAERDEVVSIIPSDLNVELLKETAKHADTLVFMKCAHRVKDLLHILKEAGFTENSTIALVKRCTLPEEKVLTGKLCDLLKWDVTADYFSVAILKRSEFLTNKKVDT